MKPKRLEQRLFEAYQRNSGMTLSAEEVWLLMNDEAVGSRVTNAAALDAGIEEPGVDCVFQVPSTKTTWKQFGQLLEDFLNGKPAKKASTR